MEVKAQHKNARIAARKLRLIREAIVGLSAVEARAQLEFMPGKAADLVGNVLRSAMANAQHNYSIEEASLGVADMVVDGGFVMKRSQPASKGSAHPILKRTAHVTVVLEEIGVAKGAARKGKKSQIETIAAEDFVAGQTPSKEVSEVKEKQKDVRNIKRMPQQGGDAHKSYRRKSMGEG